MGSVLKMTRLRVMKKKAANPLDEIAILREPPIKIPPDAWTRVMYADEFGLTRSTAHEELRKLVAAGKLKTAMGPMKHGGLERKYWKA